MGLVSVAENYRFLPQIEAARSALAALGPIRSARIVLLRPRAPRGWRVETALSGGGVLADMGVHHAHLLRQLLGRLTVTSAEERARARGSEADSSFCLSGTSESGTPWSIELSWCAWRRASHVTLAAEHGTLRFRPGRPGLWRIGFLGLPFARRVVAERDEYGQEALHDAWLDSVAGRAAPPIPLAEGLDDLAVVHEAYALARRIERR